MGGCRVVVPSILEQAQSVQGNVTRAGYRGPARPRGSVSQLVASNRPIVNYKDRGALDR